MRSGIIVDQSGGKAEDEGSKFTFMEDFTGPCLHLYVMNVLHIRFELSGLAPQIYPAATAATAANAAFGARVAFIHSVSHGARTEDVIRQSATKVPLAPASIQS